MLILMLTICIPLLAVNALDYSLNCPASEFEKCIEIGDPLVKEAHLVFPDNMDDIDLVCKTWNRFVDCLKYYSENCFTAKQKKQFNRAVESPIESVHQMCMQPSYQKEYLQYAPCIKNTITQNIHCGPHYNLLVEHVSQSDVISKSTLCCSQERFKQCVQRETRRLCDRGISDGPASRFSTQIIDKALSFLHDQCLNHIPNSGDCAVNMDSVLYADTFGSSTSPSDNYPWSTIQGAIPKEIYPSRSTQPPPPPPPSTASSWLPSTPSPSRYPNEISPPTDSSTTQLLGKRTRPSSYGRSNSWGESSSSPVSGNTIQMYPESPSTPTSRPDWATVSSWNGINESPIPNPNHVQPVQNDQSFFTYGTSRSSTEMSSTETWYPAAGNQLNNEVDEPNQLGLRKIRNSTGCISVSISSLLILLTMSMLI